MKRLARVRARHMCKNERCPCPAARSRAERALGKRRGLTKRGRRAAVRPVPVSPVEETFPALNRGGLVVARRRLLLPGEGDQVRRTRGR